jgi:phospholipid-translocating ATPase
LETFFTLLTGKKNTHKEIIHHHSSSMEWIRKWTPFLNNNNKNKHKHHQRILYCTETKFYEENEEEIRHQEHKYPDNRIRNTKYTPLSFIPKSLYEQFSLHMNQYFLLLAIMQLWRTISPVNPVTTWIPLLAVVGLGMLKELIDDTLRLLKDREANHKMVYVLKDDGRKVQTKSMNVRVGDLVYIRENESICADVIVLKTSEQGICYIEVCGELCECM